MSDDKFPDESVVVGDCSPCVRESYDTFAVDGKMEVWVKQPYGLDRFIRADKTNVGISSLRYGVGRKPE